MFLFDIFSSNFRKAFAHIVKRLLHAHQSRLKQAEVLWLLKAAVSN